MAVMQKIHTFDEVFDSQKVYRLILTAMSNPTRIVNIKLYSDKLFGQEQEFLAVAMTLLDNEVSFATSGDSKLAEDIMSLTLSKKETMANADFIFVSDPETLGEVIHLAKCGTLRDPHKSATIIIKVPDSNKCILHLYGAGIRSTVEFHTDRLVETVLNLRDQQYYEYPQGIDFIFVSESGNLFAIPRLTLREDDFSVENTENNSTIKRAENMSSVIMTDENSSTKRLEESPWHM